MEGARFDKVEARRGDLRWPLQKDFAKRIEGTTVTGMGRRAKYLLADLSSGDVLVMHLGMSGSFRVAKNGQADTPGQYYHERGKAAAHDHVVFHMSSGATVSFNDPRRFGSMKLVARRDLGEEPLLRRLGPEPLGNEFDAATLAAACRGKKTSLKAALLDQTVVAGLGNIYVCEALFRAGVSPRRSAHTMPGRRTRALVPIIRTVLEEAIAAGGSSLRDYVQTSGELGYFQHSWQVYGREGEACGWGAAPGGPNRVCDGLIRRITQSGRSTFYCGRHQR